MFLVASLIGGAALAAVGRHLGSTLARALPPWVTIVLAVGLITGSAVSLVGMAVQRLSGLSAEVEAQRLVINETTLKLDAANRRADLATQRADYYQRAFDARAESEGA